MKKGLIYMAGVITGIALTFLIAFLLVKSPDNGSIIDKSSNDGITIFDEPGDYIKAKEFKVFQVIEPGAALAQTKDPDYTMITHFDDPVVLFVNDDGKYYYDDEIIEVPSGKRARQIGVCTYPTKMRGEYKTVPIVKIME